MFLVSRENVSFWLLSVLVLTLVFFRGGRNDAMGVFAFSVITLLFLFLKPAFGKGGMGVTVKLLGLFLFWIFATTLTTSNRPYASFITALPVVSGALVFLILQSFRVKEAHKRLFAFILTGGALGFALYGIYVYLSPLFIPLRLGSTFFQHNAFAGFLIPPFMFALYGFLYEDRIRILSFTAAFVILITLFLTFSRGGMISVAFSLFIFIALLLKKEDRRIVFKNICLIVLMVGGALIISYGLYSIKLTNFQISGIASAESPFSGERPEEGETGILSRFEYMKAALTLFKEHPFFGVGLGAFGQEYLRIQNDPRFFSADPHNTYLRMFAELGIGGGILFLLFIGFVFITFLRRYLLHGVQDPFSLAFFAGTLGLFTHYAIDIDFTFPAHVLYSFTLLGFIESEGTHVSDEIKRRGRFWYGFLLSVSFLLTIITFLMFMSDFFWGKAIRSRERGDAAQFEYFMSQSFRWNPVNPATKVSFAGVLFEEGRYDEALAVLGSAKAIHPHDRAIFILEGRIYKKKEDFHRAEGAYRTALVLAPYRDFDAVFGLVSALLAQGKKEEAQGIARSAVMRFPDLVFESSLWAHPNKEDMRLKRVILKSFSES